MYGGLAFDDMTKFSWDLMPLRSKKTVDSFIALTRFLFVLLLFTLPSCMARSLEDQLNALARPPGLGESAKVVAAKPRPDDPPTQSVRAASSEGLGETARPYDSSSPLSTGSYEDEAYPEYPQLTVGTFSLLGVEVTSPEGVVCAGRQPNLAPRPSTLRLVCSDGTQGTLRITALDRTGTGRGLFSKDDEPARIIQIVGQFSSTQIE